MKKKTDVLNLAFLWVRGGKEGGRESSLGPSFILRHTYSSGLSCLLVRCGGADQVNNGISCKVPSAWLPRPVGQIGYLRAVVETRSSRASCE